MRGVARFLIRLYPASWRARYGEEFEALLEDSSSSWPAIFDLLKGAIKMQFSVPTFPKLALMLSITGLLIGLLVSALVPPTYVSRAELQVTGAPAGSAAPHPKPNLEYVMRFENQVLSNASLAAIILDPILDLYPEERPRGRLQDAIDEMRQRILIRVDKAETDRLTFHIAFTYSDRVKAQQTVQRLLVGFSGAYLNSQRARSTAGQLDQFHRLEARVALLEKRLGLPPSPPEPGDQLAPVFASMNLEVLDPPSLPVRAASPNPWTFAATGFGAGFVAALVIALFRRRPPAVPFPAQTT